MENFIAQYNYYKNVDNIKDIATYELYTKLLLENKVGDSKLTYIDTTDQESILKGKELFLPGLIYTFMYMPEINELNVINNKNFMDIVPIIFCLGYRNNLLHGINLNLIPPLSRLNFINTYYLFYEKFFSDLENYTENNVLRMNEMFIQAVASEQGQKVLNVMSEFANDNFKFAYRTYNLDKIMSDIRLIEYSDWKYIPFYININVIKDIDLNNIYKEYIKNNII